MTHDRAVGHALVATALAAGFWAWLASDPWIVAIQLGPMLAATFVPGALRVRIEDSRLVWVLAFTIGGTLAAVSLRFHPVR
jgi:hypothetical protein